MKKQGHIIIVEGLWGAGKSTLIKKLAMTLGGVTIPEPDHRGRGLHGLSKITRWYFSQHEINLAKAYVRATRGETVIIERSPLSSMAFMRVYLEKNAPLFRISNFKKFIKKARNAGITCLLIYVAPRDIDSKAKEMKTEIHLNHLAERNKMRKMDTLLKKLVHENFS